MSAAERTRARARTPSETRAERRRALQLRRHRTMFVGATVVAVMIMAAWFPASDLLHQHEQLASATTELHSLDQKNHALEKKAAELETPSDIERIAQQQYDLVPPGDQPYQVLPPSGSGNGAVLGATGATSSSTSSSSTSSSSTAPASSSAPSGAASHQNASSGPGGTTGGADGTSGTTGVPATSAGFFSRVLQTLEFWR